VSKKMMTWIGTAPLVAVALAGALMAQETSQDTEEVTDDLAVALQQLDSALGALELDRSTGVRQWADPSRTQGVEPLNFADSNLGAVPAGLEATEAVLTLAITRTKEAGGGIGWKILDFSKKNTDVEHHQLVITYKRPDTP